MTLNIRITGEGTNAEIVKALEGVIASLVDYDGTYNANWEDPILYTQVSPSRLPDWDPRLGHYQELLRHAVHALNEIPNTQIRSSKFRNSYEVASLISQAIRC